MLQSMKPPRFAALAPLAFLLWLGYLHSAFGQPPAAALSRFDSYTQSVERRLEHEHQAPSSFLQAIQNPAIASSLRAGTPLLERLSPAAGEDVSGALLHDWRGTAFVPRAKAKSFEALLRDIPAYPQIYSPQVLQASAIPQQGDHLQVMMRVRQKHIIAVVMDSAYDVSFGRLDARHGYSTSRSTTISEVSGGRRLSPAEDHGFLWRLNTYWSYEERDGGLYLQVESISLSRSIPPGLGWAVRPFIESVPRESLEFTLRATCAALQESSSKSLQLNAKSRKKGLL